MCSLFDPLLSCFLPTGFCLNTSLYTYSTSNPEAVSVPFSWRFGHIQLVLVVSVSQSYLVVFLEQISRLQAHYQYHYLYSSLIGEYFTKTPLYSQFRNKIDCGQVLPAHNRKGLINDTSDSFLEIPAFPCFVVGFVCSFRHFLPGSHLSHHTGIDPYCEGVSKEKVGEIFT